MATVIEPTNPPPPSATKVDAQIAEATSRIRGHDLARGGLLVAGLVLGYAAGMVVLDKSFVLPEWVRQLALVGFIAGVGAVAYRVLVRPLRLRVNPLYAAVAVEKTIDDAKNSVAGYVEARGRGDVHPAVKAAMGARAARSVDDADVNRAVDHRGLVAAGGVVVALFLTLVVLFFVFRPAQFQSLLGRAFAPFSAGGITSRTQLAVVEPQGGDVTVTAGQSITVKVEVAGRVPRADRPDRVRLLLRYNPAAAEYDELPLEPGETSREWFVQVRPEQLRTGAWYKVAGGDGETPEYRVTVRTAPLFTDFEVSYEYPAYTRRPAETSTDPHLQAIRNTKVSVVAKANRPARDGRAAFDPPAALAGKAVPGRPDALRFDFLIAAPGSYRLTFTAADGERSPDSLPFAIKVDEDAPPQVAIALPEPDEITLPANGLLSVDGAAGDDYGLDKLTLKLKLAAPDARPLADRPYQNGKSFRRDADGTYPRSLEYKDSVELPKLTDAAGGKVELKEGMVLEYWLEATDNRTKPGPAGPEPDPNVGRSKVKRVRLAPPVTAPDQKQDQDTRRDQRQQEEQKHAQDQQQKLNTEDRGNPPPKQDNPEPKGKDQGGMPPDGNPMPQDMGKGADGTGMGKMPPDKTADPMMPPGGTGANDGKTPPDPNTKSAGMPMDPKQDGKGNPGGMPPPNDKQNGTPNGMPQDNMGSKGGTPETAPMPSDPGRKDVQNKADQVQNELNQEKAGGGGAKSAPTAKDEERANPADQKANGPTDGMPPESPPKGNPGGAGASEPRPEGKVNPPESPSATKTEPKTDPNPMGGKAGNNAPSEKRSEPLGGEPGAERDPGKGGEPPPGNPMTKGMPPPKDDPAGRAGMPPAKGDPSAGGTPKAGPQQKGDDSPMGAGSPQPTPADDPGRAKTAPPSNDRGAERPPAGGEKGQPDAAPQPGGDPKAERPPEPGAVRPMPKGGDPTQPDGKDETAKGGDPMGTAAEPRGGPSPMTKEGDPKMGNPMGSDPKGGMPQSKAVDPGTERSNPGDPQPMGGRPEAAPMPKQAGSPSGDPTRMTKGPNDPAGSNPKAGPPPKLDGKTKADVEQAAKDLTNPDPAKQQEARDKLDRSIGKDARQKAEDIAKGLNSTDPAEQERARRELDDLRRQAEQKGADAGPKGPNPMPMPMDGTNPMPMGGADPKGRPDSKFDPKELDNALKNLDSKDETKRQQARDTLDKAGNEGVRRQVEQLKDDLKSPDPARQQRALDRFNELKQRIERMAKDNPPGGKGGDETDRFNPGGGGPEPKNAPAIEDDPRNRAKSAQLSLDRFEKNRDNRDLRDRLGWTQEEYDRFVDDYRREVDRLRRDAAEADRPPPAPPPAPPRPVDINAGGKVEGNPNAARGAAGVGGPAFAAPGYGDALRRFQEGATQRPPAKKP